MKVFMYDNLFMALQQAALEHGHDLTVYSPGVPRKKPAEFRAVASTKGKITQVMSEQALLDAWASHKGESLLVLSHWQHEMMDRVMARKSLMPTADANRKSVIGSTYAAKLLEIDRAYARGVVQRMGFKNIKVAGQIVTDNRALALAHAKNHDTFVIKEHPSTNGEGTATLTVVVNSEAQRAAVIAELEKPVNRWWPEDESYAGCVIEEYIAGKEIAFSAFFNGKRFVLPFIANVEQKDAQEGDRTGILTGEVGSTFEAVYDSVGAIPLFFEKLEPILYDKHVGMVDANFILKGGTLFLVEFTVRFGRPTLENQCAMIEGDIIKQFHDAAVFRSNRMDYEDDYGVAITLYHYGYPLLQRFDPDQLNVLVEAPRFDLPAGEGIRSVPFFSLFIGGKWQGIVEDGRYAVVMGMGANMNIAHTNAVKALKNVRIPQVTWRRDIGTTHHDVMSDLRKRGIV